MCHRTHLSLHLPPQTSSEFIHDVTCKMISNVAKVPRARSIVVQEGGDKVLMMFVRESRVKQVLVNACAGLSYLCSESKVLRAIVQGTCSQFPEDPPEYSLPVIDE